MKIEPTKEELSLLDKLVSIHNHEYALIRLTNTMLIKSIMDATYPVRELLNEYNIINFNTLPQGPEHKIIHSANIVTNVITPCKTSFYRPLTKKGDPRFWIYGLKKHAQVNDLIYITIFNNELTIIPLKEDYINIQNIKHFFNFNNNSFQVIKQELVQLLKEIKDEGPIISVSPYKISPKDIGETLENKLGIKANSEALPDFKDGIELKAKRANAKTKDTLFSMVPNWKISPISSANEMIRTYGYPSNKYQDFIDLYVTVSIKKNPQGLYLELNEEAGLLQQVFEDTEGNKTITCYWKLEDIKQRLFTKHPSTVWIIGEECLIDGKIHFHYKKAEYTEKPLFSSFLLLLSQGYITYDWRGRVKSDGTQYKDKGHCFRILPKYRDILFTTTITDII